MFHMRSGQGMIPTVGVEFHDDHRVLVLGEGACLYRVPVTARYDLLEGVKARERLKDSNPHGSHCSPRGCCRHFPTGQLRPLEEVMLALRAILEVQPSMRVEVPLALAATLPITLFGSSKIPINRELTNRNFGAITHLYVDILRVQGVQNQLPDCFWKTPLTKSIGACASCRGLVRSRCRSQ